MSHSHLTAINPAGIELAIVGPDGREGMLAHAQQLADHSIPFVFDPGQGMPMFEAPELQWFVKRARYLALNDYEAQLMQAKTGTDLATLAKGLEALIVTEGAQGSRILADGKELRIPAAPVRGVQDPTGCGDAYRAGLLYGITHRFDWPTTGRLASVMGAMKIEQAGAQRHAATREQIAERFNQAFGYRPW
jgi:adenosine kinase